jgi:hypothetical protein
LRLRGALPCDSLSNVVFAATWLALNYYGVYLSALLPPSWAYYEDCLISLRRFNRAVGLVASFDSSADTICSSLWRDEAWLLGEFDREDSRGTRLCVRATKADSANLFFVCCR